MQCMVIGYGSHGDVNGGGEDVVIQINCEMLEEEEEEEDTSHLSLYYYFFIVDLLEIFGSYFARQQMEEVIY